MSGADAGGELSIRAAQQRVVANKIRQGFGTTDVARELCLLQGEITEFFTAWRHGQTSGAAAELADVAIYLLGLADMVGVDLAEAVAAKLALNEARRYIRRGGVLVKDERRPSVAAGNGTTPAGDGGAGKDRSAGTAALPLFSHTNPQAGTRTEGHRP